MSFDFLRQIEHATFPLTVTDPQEIAAVEMLKAVQLISAEVPPPCKGENTSGEQPPATVFSITYKGRMLLALNPPARQKESK